MSNIILESNLAVIDKIEDSGDVKHNICDNVRIILANLIWQPFIKIIHSTDNGTGILLEYATDGDIICYSYMVFENKVLIVRFEEQCSESMPVYYTDPKDICKIINNDYIKILNKYNLKTKKMIEDNEYEQEHNKEHKQEEDIDNESYTFIDILRNNKQGKWINTGCKKPGLDYYMHDIESIEVKDGVLILNTTNFNSDIRIPINTIFEEYYTKHDFYEAYKALNIGYEIKSIVSNKTYALDNNSSSGNNKSISIEEMNGLWIVKGYNKEKYRDYFNYEEITRDFRTNECNANCCEMYEECDNKNDASCVLDYIERHFNFIEKE